MPIHYLLKPLEMVSSAFCKSTGYEKAIFRSINAAASLKGSFEVLLPPRKIWIFRSINAAASLKVRRRSPRQLSAVIFRSINAAASLKDKSALVELNRSKHIPQH